MRTLENVNIGANAGMLRWRIAWMEKENMEESLFTAG